jgi:hypothetical protein
LREARIELFEQEVACEAKRKREYEFSSLGFFVSFWADARNKNRHFGIFQTNLIRIPNTKAILNFRDGFGI